MAARDGQSQIRVISNRKILGAIGEGEPQWLKPASLLALSGTAEAVPLPSSIDEIRSLLNEIPSLLMRSPTSGRAIRACQRNRSALSYFESVALIWLR
jgi:hypothetical protein